MDCIRMAIIHQDAPGLPALPNLIGIGIQDNTKLAGYSKSSKHRKAEELITKGKGIRILSEKDFKAIAND